MPPGGMQMTTIEASGKLREPYSSRLYKMASDAQERIPSGWQEHLEHARKVFEGKGTEE